MRDDTRESCNSMSITSIYHRQSSPARIYLKIWNNCVNIAEPRKSIFKRNFQKFFLLFSSREKLKEKFKSLTTTKT
jgi:hypothetical protein